MNRLAVSTHPWIISLLVSGLFLVSITAAATLLAGCAPGSSSAMANGYATLMYPDMIQ